MATHEKLPDKRERALQVLTALDALMPEAKIELDHQSPLQLVVAVVLSAQCTDKRVNLVTPALFRDFPTAAHYAAATPEQLEAYLKSLGLFRAKARNLVGLGKQLVAQHGGAVPLRRAELELLPGVGNKTAGVVTMHSGGDTAFPVDTHVLRLSGRLGFTRAKKPDDVEADLRKLVPEAWWFKGHQLLVWHGRRTCFALKPDCERCAVRALCPRIGVKAKRLEASAKATAAREAGRPPKRRAP
jgi:endonuclease-3